MAAHAAALRNINNAQASEDPHNLSEDVLVLVRQAWTERASELRATLTEDQREWDMALSSVSGLSEHLRGFSENSL